MNELYVESMAAAVDRLYDELEADPSRSPASSSPARRRPSSPAATSRAWSRPTRTTRRPSSTWPRGSRPSCAASRPSRARSWPRSTAPRSAAASRSPWPATTASRSTTPRSPLGLPEASLGLLPGGGGVTRIVRLLGLQTGLMDVLLRAPSSSRPQAKEKGLVDELVATREDLLPAAKAWIKANPEAAQNPWDAPGYKMPGGTPKSPGAGRLPAGVPGAAAQADQGRGLPRPAGDPVRRGRGRAGRLRHRLAHRVALPDQPGRQPGLEEHDPGVLLRPAGDQRPARCARRASSRGRPPRSASSAPG